MFMLMKTLCASVIAFSLTYPIWLTAVPKDFPPFSALPILSRVVIAPMVAASIYAIIRHTNAIDPDRIFFFVTLTVFALSFALPLRLSFTQSSRFAGVTPQAQMILVLLHAIVAVSTFLVLTYRTKAHEASIQFGATLTRQLWSTIDFLAYSGWRTEVLIGRI